MHPIRLEFSTDDKRLIELCNLYWQLDVEQNFTSTTAEISKGFGIKTQGLHRLVAQYCKAYSTSKSCVDCGAPYVYASRSDFSSVNHQREWVCANCVAGRRSKAQAAQSELESQQREIIRREYNLSNRQPIDISKLTLEDAVYLLSVIRVGVAEDFAYIWPLDSATDLLAPTEEFKYDIMRHLYRHRLLLPHPESPPNAFEFEGDSIERFYLDRVLWALPIGTESDNPQKFVAKLERTFREMNWPETWSEEMVPLWKTIAVQECLQYLTYVLDEHGLHLDPGEKTYLVLNEVLEHFSVAQAYNFIWRAARDAAAFYVREQVSKKHAANTVVGAIQRAADRAQVESWEVKPFRRNYKCPQSMVSQVLFNVVLQIGEDGFNKPPGQ